VRTLLTEHKVYVTDWVDARMVPLDQGTFTLNDYVGYIREFIRHVGAENLHVIAVCQPAVPVLAAASLMAAAGEAVPRSLILMGGSIDSRRSPTKVNEFATTNSLAWFERSLLHTVPPPYPGQGRRVYPGFLQHAGFMAMNPLRHMQSHWDFFQHLIEGDLAGAEDHQERALDDRGRARRHLGHRPNPRGARPLHQPAGRPQAAHHRPWRWPLRHLQRPTLAREGLPAGARLHRDGSARDVVRSRNRRGETRCGPGRGHPGPRFGGRTQGRSPMSPRGRWHGVDQVSMLTDAVTTDTPASNLFKRAWWAMALRGVIAIVLGIVMLTHPGLTLAVFVSLLGAYVFFDGVVTLVAMAKAAHRGRSWGPYLAEGLLSIAVGIYAFARPSHALVFLVLMLAVRAQVVGFVEIGTGL
jgi:hypothetical protein